MQKYDVIILGAGPVGLCLASLLANHDFLVAVVDRQSPQSWFAEKPEKFNTDLKKYPYDLRVSAISRRSEKLLEQAKAWTSITSLRRASYKKMKIYENQSPEVLEFDAKALGEQNLGHIIENSIMIQALLAATQMHPKIQFFFQQEPQEIHYSPEAIHLVTKSMSFSGELVVGADGAKSWLRDYLNIFLVRENYQQSALVATIKSEKPHQNTAFQKFFSEGILAFLPMENPNYHSIVWSINSDMAKEKLSLTTEDFEKELNRYFKEQLGELTLVSERQAFPLEKKLAQRYIDQRIALVGDAIHAIHPLAGQGLNLGLADVEVLAKTLAEAKMSRKKIGSHHVLRQYERARKFENMLMGQSMSLIKNFFNQDHLALNIIRKVSLKLLNRSHLLKQPLIRQAMGI